VCSEPVLPVLGSDVALPYCFWKGLAITQDVIGANAGYLGTHPGSRTQLSSFPNSVRRGMAGMCNISCRVACTVRHGLFHFILLGYLLPLMATDGQNSRIELSRPTMRQT